MRKSKKSSGSTILSRVQMIGEDLIPWDVMQELMKTTDEMNIFLTVPNPDDWPDSMQPLRKWIEENVPPEYWAAEE